ncbi:hypothetical protein D9M72_637320 [compost metagenome]
MCEEEESAEATVSATGTPEEQVSDQQQLERIAGALAELPERTRYVFEMCRIHGMKQKDIAESLGVSPTLVNFMIQEALLHCRKTLRD